MKIEFHPAADADVEDSYDWYAERSELAAEGFHAALHEALGFIKATPYRFGIVREEFRGCRL